MNFRLLWFSEFNYEQRGIMKIFYYFVFVLFFGACSVTTEESSSDYGTGDGQASTPVELTVGTAKDGKVPKWGYSYYKFTTSSTGAGSYKLSIASLAIPESSSSSSLLQPFFTLVRVTIAQLNSIVNHVLQVVLYILIMKTGMRVPHII